MTGGSFPIAWTPTARRALPHLPEKVAAAAVEFIYGAIADNPHRVGKPLRRELEGLHSARRGSFRIIYRITDVVTIVAIDHRADIYRTP
ncbi:MAG: type II toxin-antitoxin system RelE/ParE family toxin [Propionibacteriaceae bacterium]|nr:type II toxin-antitoxin system RelE/ParE family toxin [Micropruina sp.]HBX80227.1 type II toxin-antitoxin system RelE/ParE family toxin [Propionibacteriaceae bacterium]HBY23230.1 type II toxin-antitoxin system RelE/ParE family toxin [Propionibacteriaceae bacterium]